MPLLLAPLCVSRMHSINEQVRQRNISISVSAVLLCGSACSSRIGVRHWAHNGARRDDGTKGVMA